MVWRDCSFVTTYAHTKATLAGSNKETCGTPGDANASARANAQAAAQADNPATLSAATHAKACGAPTYLLDTTPTHDPASFFCPQPALDCTMPLLRTRMDIPSPQHARCASPDHVTRCSPQALRQCTAPTLRFEDLTMIVPLNPFTGAASTPGTPGYSRMPGNYSDPRLTWTNWDVIDGVLWGSSITNPKQVNRSHEVCTVRRQRLVRKGYVFLNDLCSRHRLQSPLAS